MACENPKHPQKLLSEVEASHYIAMSRPWLRVQRMRQSGPSYLRIGRAIRYSVPDLDAWMDRRRVVCADES